MSADDAHLLARTWHVEDIDRLRLLHAERGLTIQTANGPLGHVHVNHDPHLFVTELLQLARFAVVVRDQARAHPNASAIDVVDAADQLMRKQR